MRRSILAIALVLAAFSISGEVIPPIESLRTAIEFRRQAPEKPFRLGEILYFTIIGKNIAADTAICYALSAGEIDGDSIEPYSVVSVPDKYVQDTLAPGDSAVYHVVAVDGSPWLYDPLKKSRSYEVPVGLPCYPPGDYVLHFSRMWGVDDSICFEVAPARKRENESGLLDTLAQAFVAYSVGRNSDVVEMAHRLFEMAPESPYTARCLILARGVAWQSEMCEEAMIFDSLFWANFGELPERWHYVSCPGFLGATAGILDRCAGIERRISYLDWLEKKISDSAMQEGIGSIRSILIK